MLARRGRLSGIAPVVNVVEAQSVSSLEIAVDAMASVAGRVSDERERGVAGTKVVLWSPEGAAALGARHRVTGRRRLPDRLRIYIRVLGTENLVPEYRELPIPAGGATVDVGIVKLMKTEGPWFERSRDGVGPATGSSPSTDGT